MGEYAVINKSITELERDEKQGLNEAEEQQSTECDLEQMKLLPKESDFCQINDLYDECLKYLKDEHVCENSDETESDTDYEMIKYKSECKSNDENMQDLISKNEVKLDLNSVNETKVALKPKIEITKEILQPKMIYKVVNELKSHESINSIASEPRSDRLRKLSQTLPKIIVTQSNTSLNVRRHDDVVVRPNWNLNGKDFELHEENNLEKEPKIKDVNGQNKSPFDKQVHNRKSMHRPRPGYGDFPKRLVSKRGLENIALISNVPFEKIRLLNDTFHTLINLRWRWIVTGTIVVHFAIWLIFAVFWYITALAHYDFEPNPPKRTCITGGHDFLTIFLASVEAQTTIGFGDRAIDEECPESIFLFIMQLILGTGLSGVLTCVVYAKLTRPEKLSRDGVGFSKKAVLSMRDGKLCLMLRAWDLNYDHIISSEFNAHFVHTYRSKEGEIIRYYAESLKLQQRQFLLWPVTLVHVIDESSPLFNFGPEHVSNSNYEITVSLKGASASMGTFTQSQTSYLPREVIWGHRFLPVVKYDRRKHKYVIDHKKLDATEPVDTPFCSAEEVYHSSTPQERTDPPLRPGTPGSFSEKISSFQLGRSSSFRKKATKG